MRKVTLSGEERMIITLKALAERGETVFGVNPAEVVGHLESYLALSDEVNHTEDLKIFSRLYFSTDGLSKIHLDKIAESLYIGERTLFRYRKRYISLIAALLKRCGIMDGISMRSKQTV